ncbi:transcriptional regulator, LacI family [Caldithrix abyssi DSM 13497]|uniref:Transcriptional regulator, LacI family n=1 Tax=Caldithrix abyssi DSM 13497 TaxID=880073 RepID=H1XX09_CALAY|nr:transcriptional regulator, LacI family [Caldithrix abyssi DSM 13497]
MIKTLSENGENYLTREKSVIILHTCAKTCEEKALKTYPTIKDIAAKLNLHYTTVSRALRDHPDVNEETKRLVKETAQQMNYRPNYLARSLKRQKSNSIGVIVPEIKHHFFSAVISGIEEVAYEAGYVILVAQSNEQMEREILNLNAFISSHVSGLLVSISQTTTSSDHFKKFMEQDGKIVFFDRVCEDLEASKVVVDDYDGAYKATEYLIKKGYKRIGHLAGSKNLNIARNRYLGYKDALKNNGLTPNEAYVYWGGLQEQDGRNGMKALLELTERPDAIFAVNDPVAIGAYDVLKQKGLKIPDDMGIVGFSNNPISSFVHPPLTTVHQPAYEMGKKAAELLLQQIDSQVEEVSLVKEVLKTRLIVRESA